MKDIINNKLIINIFWSIVVIIFSLLLYKIITKFITKSMNSERIKILSDKKGKTYIKLANSITKYILIIFTFLLLLQIYGINISSVIAGVGVLGIVFGLAIQDWIKDIIRGTSILSDNYFVVGDVVKYKEIEGKVLVIGLKTTKIQDLRTSNIISIANRNIEEIQVISNYQYVTIPMPYETELEKAEKAIEDIIKIAMESKNINNCRYIGVNELGESSIRYLVEITGNTNNKLQARRDFLRAILVGLAKHKIEVPYNQLDIHQKK